ncbi:MAG: hypothetical protein GXY47_12045 [Acidobacteria bacterium]|nr:hypothetical protein [Acidobacteriota bacterium]
MAKEQKATGVLYVLDGESHLHHTIGTTRFLGGFPNDAIPPLLVVAIGTTNRMRDLTPPSETLAGSFLSQGGAGQFLQFIVEELKPRIDKDYRTTGYSVLIGHSLGGLFAMYTFVNRPGSFDSYLLIDPSLNWNDQELVSEVEAFLDRDQDMNASLYFVTSSDEDPALDGLRETVGILEMGAPDGLRWGYNPLVREEHGTVALPGIYKGLQWIFSNWRVAPETTFSDLPAEEVLTEIDELYRSSGEQFGMERATPYLAFESLLGYLLSNNRLDEAATLTLRHADRYPLLHNVVAGIAGAYASRGDDEAAAEYLLAVLDVAPDNETAIRVLGEKVSLAQESNMTGIFSTFRLSDKSGDMSGAEIHVVPNPRGYSAIVQASEGAPGFPEVVNILVKGTNIVFLIPEDSASGFEPGKYIGTVTKEGLKLRGPKGIYENYFMPRKHSYWE